MYQNKEILSEVESSEQKQIWLQSAYACWPYQRLINLQQNLIKLKSLKPICHCSTTCRELKILALLSRKVAVEWKKMIKTATLNAESLLLLILQTEFSSVCVKAMIKMHLHWC